jgi:hypothetical protein
MKSNAPEKLYVDTEDRLSDSILYGFTEKRKGNDIEYIRKDDFVEKTCKWLKESITNNPECNRIISKKGVITMGLLIEDFKNYMKGE